MDGTCTGEHGVGQGKRKYMLKELGNAVNVMKSVKEAFDPHKIMNQENFSYNIELTYS